MDYGSLIRRSWSLTWRHRFLWILGLFAGGSFGGSCSTSGGNPASSFGSGAPSDGVPPDVQPAFDAAVRWLTDNWWLILVGVLAVLAIGLVFLVLSIIAQGGSARATTDLALGRTSSLGVSWRAGTRLFWRYLGLWLLLAALGLGIVILVGGAGLAVALLFGLSDPSALAPLLVVGGLLALLLFVIAIPLFIALSIVVAYAQRAIAVEDIGPVAALAVGVRLLRTRPMISIVSWLIQLVLSIVAGVAILIGLAIVMIPLGILGVIVYFAVDLSVTLWVYIAVAGILVLLVAWLLGGIFNAYFWSFWSLVYLRCTDRLGERLEAPPATP